MRLKFVITERLWLFVTKEPTNHKAFYLTVFAVSQKHQWRDTSNNWNHLADISMKRNEKVKNYDSVKRNFLNVHHFGCQKKFPFSFLQFNEPVWWRSTKWRLKLSLTLFALVTPKFSVHYVLFIFHFGKRKKLISFGKIFWHSSLLDYAPFFQREGCPAVITRVFQF